MTLDTVPTPALILDEARMARNIARLQFRIAALGATLRPHMKTAKSVEVARRQAGDGPITVSTLKEAEVFHDAGYNDILYAVGISPDKMNRVEALRRNGCDLTVVLDSVAQAQAIAAAGIPALIEIDCDGHRSGIAPRDPLLVELGRILQGNLRGVVTHAGESYNVAGADALAAFAERERLAAVQAADLLREAGLPCPVVSVGSTPTAHFARDLTGVTEVRAGVYVFFDLVMAGIGVCGVDDVALSVLATVIGHQSDRGWIITDAGWMAMSRDRGTARQQVDQGYGLVCSADGRPIAGLKVEAANQEHSILTCNGPLPDMPIGTRLRILPNHACATAAQHDRYIVLPADPAQPLKTWPRFGGW